MSRQNLSSANLAVRDIIKRGGGVILRPPSCLRVLALICLTSIICLLACSAPTTLVRESSAPVKPAWIEKPPQGGETLYFVGIRSYADTLEDGQTAAINDAMSKISGFLGIRIESMISDEVTEVTQDFRQQIKSKTKSNIKGASIVDSYYEKVTRIDGDYKIEKYDVFVLVSFSKQEAEREVRRQQTEKENKIRLAYEYYQKGIVNEKAEKYYQAREYFSQALSAANEVDDSIAVDGGDIQNSEDLKHGIQLHLADVSSQLLKVTITLKTNGSQSQIFESNFSAQLSKSGFIVTGQRAAYKITGNVSLSDGGYVLNNHVSYAEGRVTARRTSDGQVVAVYPFRVKGFHRTKEQSAIDALKEAGTDAGSNLSALLLEKNKHLSTGGSSN